MTPADFHKSTPRTTRFASCALGAVFVPDTKHPPKPNFHFDGKRVSRVLCGLVFGLFLGKTNAAGVDDGRGEMLYQNHCIGCHTTQVHWREQRLARDWKSLRAQVRRWERNTGLSWSDEDVEAVSRYLNQLYYQFSDPPLDKIISFLRNQDSSQNFFARDPVVGPFQQALK